MPEHLNMDWIESFDDLLRELIVACTTYMRSSVHRVNFFDWLLQSVFEYFVGRTPSSFLETRDASLVWNHKFAEFGRVQAKDMLQHLWTGPVSNAAVDVVHGAKSVEVCPVGV